MRVVVVGGGLAGSVAALELSRRGVEVTLLDAAPGCTALMWGTLDVAPAVPGSRRLRWRSPLRDAPLTGADRLAILIGAYATHPYAVLWRRPDAQAGPEAGAPAEEVKRAVADLHASLMPHGLGLEGSLDANRLLADVHGAVRVSDFAFSGAAGGDLSQVNELAWVRIRGLPATPAAVAVRRLAAERATLGLAPIALRTVELVLPEGLPTDSVARLAAALDRPEGGMALREAAQIAAREKHAAGRLWLFPPVLGLGDVVAQLEALREVLGGPVAEMLGAVPEVTAGFRLRRALSKALDGAGVERIATRVSGVEIRDGRAAGVRLARGGDPEPARETDGHGEEATVAADALILATGRFLAGGLRDGAGQGSSPRGVREALLDLPLFDAQGVRVDGRPARAALRQRSLDLQPLFSAGVAVDGRLRPLSAPGGAVVLPNLHAAGDLVGGFDPSRERTGGGVALLTGVLAARHAATRSGS